MTKKIVISVVVACICVSGLTAEEFEEFGANIGKLAQKELSATQAVEMYSKKDIENSKAKDIYEFLGSNTSVITAPYFGNKAAQSLDIRGFGGENGYANVVVVVDGKRLNNIDQVAQLLSAIPVESINKIEILKGSGGVEYGDGANSVISITTMDYDGFGMGGSYGIHNTQNGWANYGYKGKNFNISANIDSTKTDGDRKFDANGNDANAFSKNGSVSIKYSPTDALLLTLSRSNSHIDTKYASWLTKNKFDTNPAQVGDSPTQNIYDVDSIALGALYDFGYGLKIETNLYQDDKTSQFFGAWSNAQKYSYKSFITTLTRQKANLDFNIGVDGFDGVRKSPAFFGAPANDMTKENLAFFAKSVVKSGNSSLELGLRGEKVSYDYAPLGVLGLKTDDFMQAYSISYNYKMNQQQGLFANYSKVFTAPDLDRFFTYNFGTHTYQFNGSIKPQKADNYNVGYSFISKNDKLKISAFYTKLENEIFFYDPTPLNGDGINTNLDSTHKIGFELSEKHRFDDIYSAFATYSYVDAIIDKYKNNNLYKNKHLPGVSNHSAVFGLDVMPTNTIKLSISERFRSSAYNYGDYINTGIDKQPAFYSTDLSASYTFKSYELFARATNIFGTKNTIVTKGVDWNSFQVVSAYYPTDFEATYTIGFKAKF